MSRPLEVVTLSVDQIREIVGEELAKALDNIRRRDEADGQGLSLSGAAKMARTRRCTVQAALETGALKGHRHGTRWSITAKAIRDWLDVGKPVAP